jgi:hypothetical protein
MIFFLYVRERIIWPITEHYVITLENKFALFLIVLRCILITKFFSPTNAPYIKHIKC